MATLVIFAWVPGALGLCDGETPVVGPGIDWLPRVLSGIEASIGLALMALLMVCVVRKFSR